MLNGKKCQLLEEPCTFDEAVSRTGFGRFHYKLSAVCALSILCVGFQNGLSSYVFSAAQCDVNIQSQDLGLLNVSFLLGGTISAFLWGVIADVNGRKKVLIVTLILDCLVTLLCSVMHTFTSVMICRFLNGLLIGCPGSVSFTYLAEFYAPKYRAKSVCYSGIAFITAWVLLPILSFFILPLNFRMDILGIPCTPWRVLLIILAVPELLAGVFLLNLPESPKFLHGKNQHDRALSVLKRMYSENTGNDCENFAVKRLLSDFEHIEMDDMLVKCNGKNARLLYDMVAQFKKLFSVEIRTRTVLLCLIMLCNMFGYFGLGLWLPEFFIRFEEHYKLHPNTSISLQELTFAENANSTLFCFTSFDLNTFINTLIVAATALVCNSLAGYLAGKVSVKNLALTTMVFGGFSSLSIYWIRSSLGILLVSSIFQASMATGNMVIGGIVVEQFPTAVGAMALSMVLCSGRLGAIASNALFSILLGKNNGVVIFIVSGVMLLGGVLCILVPSNAKSDECDDKDKSFKNSNVNVQISFISKNEDCNVTVQSS